MTKRPVPIADRLRALTLFAGLECDPLMRVVAGTSEAGFRGGQVIFRQGDPCTGLHIVVQGQVKLSFQTGRGDEKVVELIGGGSSFGETALFLGERHILTAEAIADTTLLHVAKEVVLEEVRNNTDFAERVIGELSRRLHERTRKLESHMMHSGTQRVIGFLLTRLPAGAAQRAAAVKFPAKKGIIASWLNLTHEHFSRILHELAAAELIEVDGRDVRIPDIGRLRDHSLDQSGVRRVLAGNRGR